MPATERLVRGRLVDIDAAGSVFVRVPGGDRVCLGLVERHALDSSKWRSSICGDPDTLEFHLDLMVRRFERS